MTEASASATDAGTSGGSSATATGEPAVACALEAVALFTVDPVSEPPRVFAGDIDADGDVDIVTLAHDRGQAYFDRLDLWRADGLDYVLEDSIDTPPYFSDGVLAEVDDTPGLDLVLTVFDDDGFSAVRRTEVYRFAAGGGPGFPTPVATVHDSMHHNVKVADLDGDGRADFYIQRNEPAEVQVWRGLGDGSFVPTQTFGTLGCGIKDSVVVDLDHDSWPDIITVGECKEPLVDPPLVLHRGGPEGFGAAEPVADASGSAIALFVGHVDGDPWADVLAYSTATESLLIARGDAEGGLSPAWTYPARLPRMRVADLDQDGLDDLVSLGTWHRATGEWFEPCTYPARAEAVLDLDGQGPLEIVGVGGGGEVSAHFLP